MSEESSKTPVTHVDDDAAALAELGYKQELHRGMSGFSNFAVSFSIISILAGCITSFNIALKSGGPTAITIGWPLVGIFVHLLRIPYAYLYPLIIMFCIIGVYEVAHSIVDVWIMLIMGVVGYALKKFSFDPAPLVLGLVIAPIFEMSLRQSLIMSDGNWLIFMTRPIAATLMVAAAVLLVTSALSAMRAQRDWRTKMAAEAGET